MRSTTSSMRAGWMRPSLTSCSSARRAISRRSGSNVEISTASGVSSTMRLTPVIISKARMLRPSRPMTRPFMSSEGSSTTETVCSATWLLAARWMAIEMMCWAFLRAVPLASSSMRRTMPA